MSNLNNIMLIYPPSKLFQRGEDRCQINIENSVSQSMRACNDLGYAAAVLLNNNYTVKLKDYQTEGCSYEDLESDIINFNPSLILISTTNTTIFEDLELAKKIKSKYELFIVFKGAIFYSPQKEMLELLDLNPVDLIIGGEIDFIIDKVANFLLRNEGNVSSINNILYKNKIGDFISTSFDIWDFDLDSRPFPARQLMNNSLYTRPDTKEPMATIQTSRGCPASCIYCLSPTISGKQIRSRSPENVFEELVECYEKYGIKNFFFRADTFTINPDWVIKLCNLIINSNLYNKIQFTANSRVKPLTKEVLKLMKKAGCFAIAFGFESGSDETMSRIKKGANVEDNIRAAKLAKSVGLCIFGMFVIGFPWETTEHISQTKKMIFKLNPDFIEVTLALPFYGTELYEICKSNGLIEESIYGSDFFHTSFAKTATLSTEELLKLRKQILLQFYTRPSYILKKIVSKISKPSVILEYIRFGLRLLKIL